MLLQFRSEGGLMSFLKRRFPLIIPLSATSLLCVLLIALVAQQGVSKGLSRKPSVELQASTTKITYPCPPGFISMSRSCPSTADLHVGLTSIPRDFSKQPAYVYTVAAGRVVGEGNKVIWDLSDVRPGIYTATVEVHDNKKHRALASVIVTITICKDCVDRWFCPTLVVDCYDEVKAGTLAVCIVRMQPSSNLFTYEWSVNSSSGEDLSERISRRDASISIPTNNLAGQTVYVKVEVIGLDPSCARTASGSTKVKP
jgi:hypothetical protein